MAIKKIEAYLSGGAANTDPDLSLGGVISTTKLVSQTVSYDTTAMTGVTLVDGSALPDSFRLTFNLSDTTLFLNQDPPVDSETRVDVSVDGDYILPMPDGSGSLEITVVSASLPVATEYQIVNAVTLLHNLFDAVTSQNSQVGDINYRHLYFKNLTAGTLSLFVSILNQLNGMDYLEIGIENTSSGVDDSLLADESTAPVGVTFAAPSSSAEAIELTALLASYVGVFFKRTVVALTDTSTAVDSAVIEITEAAP